MSGRHFRPGHFRPGHFRPGHFRGEGDTSAVVAPTGGGDTFDVDTAFRSVIERQVNIPSYSFGGGARTFTQPDDE